MTLVVFGVDALDYELLDENRHPNLALDACHPIDTIVSEAGSPSTHELWPTIITGLSPDEHGLQLNDGVAWESPLLAYGSQIADYFLPSTLQTRVGAWLLNNTSQDAFRTPATYYEQRGIGTIFDGREALPIGVPNYVVDPNDTDREHELRREMGELFERDPKAATGHTSADPAAFYERCLEMTMIRIARVRRALRGRQYELVFGYTSGLDLVGHIAHDEPELQIRAYDELNEFVRELRDDLGPEDELVLVSDHGLQDGIHTEMAMIAATSSSLVEEVDHVLDVRDALEAELREGAHAPADRPERRRGTTAPDRSQEVRDHLDDLGYL